MLTPREKSPIPENFPRGGSNPRHCGQRTQTLPTNYSGPYSLMMLYADSSAKPVVHTVCRCVHEVSVIMVTTLLFSVRTLVVFEIIVWHKNDSDCTNTAYCSLAHSIVCKRCRNHIVTAFFHCIKIFLRYSNNIFHVELVKLLITCNKERFCLFHVLDNYLTISCSS